MKNLLYLLISVLYVSGFMTIQRFLRPNFIM